jgi:ATP-dependent exoDNAse (exonuclease V) alpha subunit
MIADLAFHSPEKEDGGIPNPHFHVMTTMRPLNPDGTWGQKQRREYLLDEDGNRIRDKNGDYMFNAVHTADWHEPETLEHWREQWAAAVNTKFEEKGLDVRIDHRSYVRQGLDLIPTVHEGANVRQMEAKGIRTEKGELNRWIKASNRLMQDVRKKIKALFVWMAEVKEELSKPQTPNLADLLIAYYNQR